MVHCCLNVIAICFNFLSPEWDCVVFIQASAEKIPEDDADWMKTSEKCAVIRILFVSLSRVLSKIEIVKTEM